MPRTESKSSNNRARGNGQPTDSDSDLVTNAHRPALVLVVESSRSVREFVGRLGDAKAEWSLSTASTEDIRLVLNGIAAFLAEAALNWDSEKNENTLDATTALLLAMLAEVVDSYLTNCEDPAKVIRFCATLHVALREQFFSRFSAIGWSFIDKALGLTSCVGEPESSMRLGIQVQTWLVAYSLVIATVALLRMPLELLTEILPEECFPSPANAVRGLRALVSLGPTDLECPTLTRAKMRLAESASVQLETTMRGSGFPLVAAYPRKLIVDAAMLSKLPKLAQRAGGSGAQHSHKQTERLFEYALGNLFASLGFHVTPEIPGQPVVDHICTPLDPRIQRLCLIEAKTTAGSYDLPRDDRRAITEYISTFRERWPESAAIECLIVVGPKASSTLANKLKSLEAEVCIPVRFCTAKSLLAMREAYRGPILIADFYKDLARGGHVLADDFWASSFNRYEALWAMRQQIAYLQLGLLTS